MGKVLTAIKAEGTYSAWIQQSFETACTSNLSLAETLQKLTVFNDIFATTSKYPPAKPGALHSSGKALKIPATPKRREYGCHLHRVHGRGILPHWWYWFLSSRITVSISLRFPLFSLHRRFFFGISVQILHGTCNSISYVINYVCHSLWLTSFWFVCAVGSRTFIISKGVFIFKNHRHSLFRTCGLSAGFSIQWYPFLAERILYHICVCANISCGEAVYHIVE